MKHYSPEQRARFVEQWKSSGLPAKIFAKQNGMAISSLTKWARDHGDKPAEFKPVIVCDDSLSEEAREIRKPVAEVIVGGLSVRFFAGIGAQDASALLQAMRGMRA